MPRYKVSVYSGPRHAPQATLFLIATLLGKPNVDALKVDDSAHARGTVSLEFATVQDDLVEGIKKLDGVQAVLPLGST